MGKDRMDTFFSYIPGMMSRIGNHIDFPNYDPDELVKIASVMARDLEYDIEEAAYPVFKDYIEKRMELPYFSNARTVRNAMDRARMNSAIRTFEKYAINGKTTVCVPWRTSRTLRRKISKFSLTTLST